MIWLLKNFTVISIIVNQAIRADRMLLGVDGKDFSKEEVSSKESGHSFFK